MKKILIIFQFIIPLVSYCQYNYGFLKESFFGRLPSARAEALGRSYSSIDGDLTTIFFNPAGIASINGLEIDGSYASPFYLAKDAKYNFVSLSYKINDYLIIGLTRNYFTLGTNVILTNECGDAISNTTPNNSNYSLTFSSQPIKNLFIGLNTNYFIWHPVNASAKTFYFDFGIIKKFKMFKSEVFEHNVNIGASIKNFNYSKITLEYNNNNNNENKLPVITLYGANYQFSLNKHIYNDSLKTFQVLLNVDYQKLLNSKYESAIRTGCELMFFEILSLRFGYYNETEFDYGVPSNYSKIKGFTYGFGVQLPLNKLNKFPCNINIDYTSLPQTSYTKNNSLMDNFTILNLRINWIIKNNHKSQK